jgi:carboxymethylenebutenolidase
MCIENHRDVPAAEILSLTSADGSQFGAFHARAEKPSGGRLILLPDIGGLRADYIDLARRFAESGCDVLAIDYYGRTAGAAAHGAEFDHVPHAAEARREDVVADIAAAVAYLDTVGSGPTYTVGFCIGGAHSLFAGTALDLDGVIAFCPWTGASGHSAELPDDFVLGLRCPMLGLFGASDTEVPAALAESFEASLSKAGLPHEIAVYPGQPHGFFEWHHLGRDGHAEAAQDAWERVAAFLKP